ncbi:hypothetical protein EDB84DRAFT_1687 [Lactarius hengduanensis]|nr:hypothetical protein EDB84DRAFT_1687 [Lactarius hengduanensis]
MTEKTPTDAILGSRLYDLLKTCMPGTSPLNDEERKSRLRLCLKSLWYFGRAYNQSRVSEPLPSYFPRTLASPEIIRLIQTEQDPVSRVMGRCFGALVVVKLAADVRSRTGSSVQINHEELACLSAILDAESRDVIFCLKWAPSSLQAWFPLHLVMLTPGPSTHYRRMCMMWLNKPSLSFLSPSGRNKHQTWARSETCTGGHTRCAYKGRNTPGSFNRVSQGPVALCTSVQSTRQLSALAALCPHCFRKPSYVSSHTHGTGRLCPCDWTLRRGIGCKEACSWRRIKHRLKCSNRRRGAGLRISYSWHQTR